MKDLGLPILYDRYRQSYYYENPIQLFVNVSFKNLSSGEIIKIEGGNLQVSNNNLLKIYLRNFLRGLLSK